MNLPSSTDKLESCPYQEVCICPGYDPEDGHWIPVEGFKKVNQGIFCIDWNITLGPEKLVLLKRHEARFTFNPEAVDKMEAAHRKYRKTDKRRATQRRYEQTEAGRETDIKRRNSERFKLSRRKYLETVKGKKATQEANDRVKLFRRYNNWLKIRPDGTWKEFEEAQKNA